MGFSRLTDIEQGLFNLIPVEPKDITSKELVRQFYGDDPPFNGRKIVVGRVTGIISKLRFLNSEWTIKKSNRSGPIDMRYSRARSTLPSKKKLANQ